MSTVITEGTWGRGKRKGRGVDWEYGSPGHFLHNIFLNTGPQKATKNYPVPSGYWEIFLLHIIFLESLIYSMAAI